MLKAVYSEISLEKQSFHLKRMTRNCSKIEYYLTHFKSDKQLQQKLKSKENQRSYD